MAKENGKAPKAEKEDKAPARLASRTIGLDVVRACKLGSVPAPKGATQLAKDIELSKAALERLKDEISETSAKLRAEGNDEKRVCALALGHILMGVQRMAREAK